jgi:predicted ester cyclase
MIGTTGTSVEANVALGRRFFAEQDRLHGGPAQELCAPGYQAVIGSYPAFDLAGHQGFARAFYHAFPDIHHTVDDVFATEERVAVRFVLRGTNDGDFFGMPATRRKVTVVAHVMLDVADGKVTRLQAVFDEAGMLRQMGVLPAG